MNKCREIGLKLNPDKCEFGQPSVTFYGNVVSNQGLRPDPKKVNVIVTMPAPKNKTELASFLGMCNYLSMYIPCLSDVTSTRSELNRKNVDLIWNATYDKAFRQAKLHIANAATLKYFKPQTPIVIESGHLSSWCWWCSFAKWSPSHFYQPSTYRHSVKIFKHRM